MHPACDGEPFYGEYQDKHYCVLHYPGKEKAPLFQKVFSRKLENKDFNFHGVWFPEEVSLDRFFFVGEVIFYRAVFSDKVSFRETTFRNKAIFLQAVFEAEVTIKACHFKSYTNFSKCSFAADVDFSGTEFEAGVAFSDVLFHESVCLSCGFHHDADFFSCVFSGLAEFTDAEFKGDVSFIGSIFESAADFTRTSFDSNVNFTGASFGDSVSFVRQDIGRQLFDETAALFLEFARIEHPELFTFHALTLRPTWFINADPRKFNFNDVRWLCSTVSDDLQRMRKDYLTGFHQPLLAITYRRLATNAEDNDRYREASQFRYNAMDVSRHEPWRHLGFLRRWLGFWKLSWWYWFASGYGERIFRAFLVLLGIWFVAGLLYTRVGFARWEPKLATEADVVVAKRDAVGAPLNLSRALTYSAGVMTLQRPEPRPATTAAQTVVLLETVLGPVQAALLALAIRRKFMR